MRVHKVATSQSARIQFLPDVRIFSSPQHLESLEPRQVSCKQNGYFFLRGTKSWWSKVDTSHPSSADFETIRSMSLSLKDDAVGVQS
jgi:hypothetical protein